MRFETFPEKTDVSEQLESARALPAPEANASTLFSFLAMNSTNPDTRSGRNSKGATRLSTARREGGWDGASRPVVVGDGYPTQKRMLGSPRFLRKLRLCAVCLQQANEGDHLGLVLLPARRRRRSGSILRKRLAADFEVSLLAIFVSSLAAAVAAGQLGCAVGVAAGARVARLHPEVRLQLTRQSFRRCGCCRCRRGLIGILIFMCIYRWAAFVGGGKQSRF